jgi:glycerol-1-phosphate dehydrogenase [NAD(P)+]
MIIDGREYNGLCSCQREHTMVTEFSLVESGALFQFDKYMEQFQLKGPVVAVYDENTYRATEGRHPKVAYEVILCPNDLHANEHGVQLLENELPKDAKVLVAVGSGTVHDITRYCAYTHGIDFVSCPTAASVDGFCSSVAAMTWHGAKKTLTAVAPRFVLADLDIIKAAPLYLAKSGFGDMIGKYIALTDWKVGYILKNEYYCERIAKMTQEATDAVLYSAEGIVNGEIEAFEKLMYGLLLSGLAMQMIGNSRPASGAEHHISHIIEMSPEGLDVCSDALHGEKVGVGTLLAVEEYHRIATMKDIQWQDYREYDGAYLYDMFGERLTEEIEVENQNDSAYGITAEMIKKAFPQIVQAIHDMPTEEELKNIYEKLQIKSSLLDIDVPLNRKSKLLEYSPCVRNRLTWMRLRKCIK